LLGQWWAHQLDLGYILPKAQVQTTMRSIMNNNWRESFAGFKQSPRVFVSDNDKGLLVCTWPKGGKPKSPTPYSDEVWTGIEYEVAGLLLKEDMVDDALKMLRGIRARYDGRERSPWNDIECGDHYARAMSSWTLLEAAAGQRYNAAQGFLSLGPKITPHDFRCFLITSVGWGNFAQKLTGGTQVNTITGAYGQIKLKTLELIYVGSAMPRKVTASLHGNAMQLRVTVEGKKVRLESTDEFELTSGARLQVEIT
jgi:hypothetical protein